MRTILLLLFILLSFASFAQDWEFERPDYKKIETNIKNDKSNLLYDLLMAKFQEGDSTMSLEEKRHLYYGYTFQKNITPILALIIMIV